MTDQDIIIQPTIGRVVFYWPNGTDDLNGINLLDKATPCTAHIVYVHDHRLVNLTLHDHYGVQRGLSSVVLCQPGDEHPDHGYAEWPPYVRGQTSAPPVRDADEMRQQAQARLLNAQAAEIELRNEQARRGGTAPR